MKKEILLCSDDPATFSDSVDGVNQKIIAESRGYYALSTVLVEEKLLAQMERTNVEVFATYGISLERLSSGKFKDYRIGDSAILIDYTEAEKKLF